jgi:hypothetical protein
MFDVSRRHGATARTRVQRLTSCCSRFARATRASVSASFAERQQASRIATYPLHVACDRDRPHTVRTNASAHCVYDTPVRDALTICAGDTSTTQTSTRSRHLAVPAAARQRAEALTHCTRRIHESRESQAKQPVSVCTRVACDHGAQSPGGM